MEHIGRYNVVKKLITTGFSNIYLCRDSDLDVDVAVKVFDLKGDNVGEKAQYGSAVWLARFVEEAKLMARLEHPNIVKVFELAATEDGKPYFVMPFIEANLIYEIGKDEFDPAKVEKLDAQWRPKKASVGRTVFLLDQVLDALAYLHGQGIVHRDLKPGNILLTKKQGGSVRLCDFGMVKIPKSDISRSGIWIGTLDYMAPEQRRSAKEVDARADVYSAGALAYRMLTGTLPEGAFPAPHEVEPDVPREFSDLLMHAMARSRKDRPRDAAEMRRLLHATLVPWQNLSLPSIPPPKAREKKPKKPKKSVVSFKKATKATRKAVAGKERKGDAMPEVAPLPSPEDRGPVAGLQDMLAPEVQATEAPATEAPATEGPPTEVVADTPAAEAPPTKTPAKPKGGRKVAIRRKGGAGAEASGGLAIKVAPKATKPRRTVVAKPKVGNGSAQVVAVVRRPASEAP